MSRLPLRRQAPGGHLRRDGASPKMGAVLKRRDRVSDQHKRVMLVYVSVGTGSVLVQVDEIAAGVVEHRVHGREGRPPAPYGAAASGPGTIEGVPCVPHVWVLGPLRSPAPSWKRPGKRTTTLVRAIDKYRRAIGQPDRIPTTDVFLDGRWPIERDGDRRFRWSEPMWSPRRNRTGDPILTMEPPGTAVRNPISPGCADRRGRSYRFSSGEGMRSPAS